MAEEKDLELEDLEATEALPPAEDENGAEGQKVTAT